ncbi:hypothetical protein NKG05_28985 [Oerskovia sp. M15]
MSDDNAQPDATAPLDLPLIQPEPRVTSEDVRRRRVPVRLVAQSSPRTRP